MTILQTLRALGALGGIGLTLACCSYAKKLLLGKLK